MTINKRINIQAPSAQSLLLKMYFFEKFLASGTGFTIKTKTGHVLVTNRHNFTGRNQTTGEPLSKSGGVPNKVEVFHNKKGQLGSSSPVTQPLYEDLELMSKPLWHEHPRLEQADVVALPILQNEEIICYPYELSVRDKIPIAPTDIISVIGFPFGKTAGRSLAIWATGFIASEPLLSYEGMPKFLIDCRTRPGQSGSPVVVHRNAGTMVTLEGEGATVGDSITNLLGVYCGRINNESDLGVVWKTEVITEIVDSL